MLNTTRQVALVQNAGTLVAPADPLRKFIAFANIDANNILYVSNVQTDLTNGFPVMPRSYYGFERTVDKIDTTQPFYCYTTAAGQLLNVIEGFYEESIASPKKITLPKPPPRA